MHNILKKILMFLMAKVKIDDCPDPIASFNYHRLHLVTCIIIRNKLESLEAMLV